MYFLTKKNKKLFLIYNDIGLIEYWAILSIEHKLANQLSYDDTIKDFAKKTWRKTIIWRGYIHIYIYKYCAVLQHK